MPPQSSIEVRGANLAANKIRRLGARASDVRPLANRVRTVVLASNERQFERHPWPALSQETVESKRRKGQDPRPERVTGALYRSLTSEMRVKGQINRASKTRLTFGSRLWYAKFQLGTAHQPRRELIHLTPWEREIISRMMEKYVATGRTW